MKIYRADVDVTAGHPRHRDATAAIMSKCSERFGSSPYFTVSPFPRFGGRTELFDRYHISCETPEELEGILEDLREMDAVESVRKYTVESPGLWFPSEAVPVRSFDKLYHATWASNVPSILKRGLRPSGGERCGMMDSDDPDTANRVYVAPSIDALEPVIESLASASEDRIAILEITVPPKSEIFEEYPSTDPCEAYYLRKRIPPKYIRVHHYV